jgi:hypothetical protein
MEKNKHTELPWSFHTDATNGKIIAGNTYWLNGANGETILEAVSGNWSIKEDEAFANSQLIVKAVNNHYALLEALKEAIRIQDLWMPELIPDCQRGEAVALGKMRDNFLDLIKQCEG